MMLPSASVFARGYVPEPKMAGPPDMPGTVPVFARIAGSGVAEHAVRSSDVSPRKRAGD
jgi:hypothetical protein